MQEKDPQEVGNPVARWQSELKRQLVRLEPYLVAGNVVTFREVTLEERAFFEALAAAVAIPAAVCAVFIPPSVVQQAMWPGSGGDRFDETARMYGVAPDAGAVVAVRCGSQETIVNALFALPPLSPGVDVYQNDRLLAGYSYKDHRECVEGLNDILQIYLG